MQKRLKVIQYFMLDHTNHPPLPGNQKTALISIIIICVVILLVALGSIVAAYKGRKHIRKWIAKQNQKRKSR